MNKLNKETKECSLRLWRKCPHSFSSLTFIQRCLATKELPVRLVIHIFSYIVDGRDDKSPRCHCGFKSVRIKSYVINTSL